MTYLRPASAWVGWLAPLTQGADTLAVLLFVLFAGASLLFALVGGIQAYFQLSASESDDVKARVLFFGYLVGGLPIVAVAAGMYFAFLEAGDFSALSNWLTTQPAALAGSLVLGLLVIFFVRRIYADPRPIDEQIPQLAAGFIRGVVIVFLMFLLLYLIYWL